MKTLIGFLLAAGVMVAQVPDLKVDEAEAKRAAIEKPAPAYPAIAKQLKITGRVAVEAIVGTSGQVEDVRIVSGNPALTKPVADAIRKWRFTPFKSPDGTTVRAAASLSFDFRQ